MTANYIMSRRRPQIWQGYRALNRMAAPVQFKTIDEAWAAGLKKGYGLGLLAGLEFGMELGAIIPVTQTEAFATHEIC